MYALAARGDCVVDMRKVTSIVALVIGLVLVLSAAGVRWFAAPRLAVLPSNTDTTRAYAGTAATLFNEKALTSTTAGPVLLTGVPISLSHHTKVLATRGSNALVADSGTVSAAGSLVAGYQYDYAVNRTSMARGSGFSGPSLVSQTGVTFNFPIRMAKRDYPGWIPDTQSSVPLTYEGTASHAGLSTYVYRTSSQPTLITDPEVLKALPASLPKAVVTHLAAGLGLPAGQLAGLAGALRALPDPVPFSYTYQLSATYWVEPTTGEIVDLTEHEVRSLALKVGTTLIPITPVLDISYTSTPSGLAAAVHDARRDARMINLVYWTLPVIALAVGLLGLLAGTCGLLLGRRRPRRTTPVEAAPVAEPVREHALAARHRA